MRLRLPGLTLRFEQRGQVRGGKGEPVRIHAGGIEDRCSHGWREDHHLSSVKLTSSPILGVPIADVRRFDLYK
jgi:hypothetical protein